MNEVNIYDLKTNALEIDLGDKIIPVPNCCLVLENGSCLAFLFLYENTH